MYEWGQETQKHATKFIQELQYIPDLEINWENKQIVFIQQILMYKYLYMLFIPLIFHPKSADLEFTSTADKRETLHPGGQGNGLLVSDWREQTPTIFTFPSFMAAVAMAAGVSSADTC